MPSESELELDELSFDELEEPIGMSTPPNMDRIATACCQVQFHTHTRCMGVAEWPCKMHAMRNDVTMQCSHVNDNEGARLLPAAACFQLPTIATD